MTEPSPGRWPWPPLIRLSAALHAGALLWALAVPGGWRAALAVLVANHAWITATGLWPRSTGLGPNLRRLPPAAVARREVAITIDDGPDPAVTPAVLDQLDAAGARATFFVIGRRAAEHPALLREIVRRGHSVQNHSDRHHHGFSLLGPAGFAREIGAAQRRLTDLSGERPTFFRAPAGLRNPFLDPVLHRLGLRLASWTRRGFDTREADPARVLARLSDGLAAGDILLLHDGHAARGADGTPVILTVLPALLARCQAEGLRCVTLPQACDAAQPSPPPTPDAAWRRLLDAATAPHRAAGRFAWHFARGKLGFDPVFRHLLEAGLLGPQARVVDLGCGQALLPHLLLAGRALAAAGHWPAAWPAAPGLQAYTGVELMPRDVARAQAALRARQAEDAHAARLPLAVSCADMCAAPLPACDAVVILDVLHYVPIDAQDALLARVHAALAPGGALLLRIGDRRQRRGFRISQWVDRLVTHVRGHRVPPTWCRALPEWQAALEALGFAVEARPMSRGTPFANVLLVARREGPA